MEHRVNRVIEYPYAEGDRLEDRNTYFYTPSVGAAMREAWTASRDAVAGRLPQPVEPPQSLPEPLPPFGSPIVTSAWLESLYGHVASGAIDPLAGRYLDVLTKKFEVTKRIYEGYDTRLLPADRSRYHDLSLYIRAAEILLAAYARTDSVPYLNAAMKIVDTLCACSDRLDPAGGARLSGLILRERALVGMLRKEPV